MIQTIDIKDIPVGEYIKFFKSEINRRQDTSKISYRKALLSFECFILGAGALRSRLSYELLANWYASMRCSRLSYKTAAFYLNIISGLYKSFIIAKGLSDPGYFRMLREAMKKYDNESIRFVGHEKTIATLFQHNSFRSPEDKTLSDFLLFCIVSGILDIYQVAFLRKDSLLSLPRVASEIRTSFISPSRKYIFPFGQTKLTPKQYRISFESKVKTFLENHGVRVDTSVNRSLSLIWASIAIEAGISPDVVLAFMSAIPADLSFLQVCNPASLSASEKEKVIEVIAEYFSSESPRWYAMSLRQGFRFPELQKRIAALSNEPAFTSIRLFCPMEEITRRIGRKIIFVPKPKLGNIVFFRSRPSSVAPLFRNIWDIAWCYRDMSISGHPYAVIRQEEMEAFRKAIGWLTPAMEVTPAAPESLKPGDKVIILDSNFFEKEGEILKIENRPDETSHTVYRVLFADKCGRWNLSLDLSQIKPK